ncbi:Detected protein of unknown function [Hibiscus syriacus]|uniref:Uncharacterized protein n=1 Tax=Hibiscus syriacus TaxID=106335 RepID=A0A6A3D603_HIBSY|nr:uncharacterized protein LOC120152796 [Hibiscus syriacus]KAE8735984.1 Detected protein of unknown function [Hibiscus syriacus]
MGCFLGCFGISTKRKRRKPANRILPGPAESRLVSYEPLDSYDSTKSQLSGKAERQSAKIRKKVSFNLNVQTYEPITDEETTTYQFLQSVEEENEKNGGEVGKGSLHFFSDGVLSSLKTSVYPYNYRYQNCSDTYDEEDEMIFEENDLEDDDGYFDDDDDVWVDDGKDVDDQFESLNMDSTKRDDSIQLDEKNQMSLCGSTDGNAKIRSQYLYSVLSPIENMTQWNEIKARAAIKPKQTRKDNVAVEEESQIPIGSNPRSNCSPKYNQSNPILQDIAVGASLSNWLISPNVHTLLSKKSISARSFSRRSQEDRVISNISPTYSLLEYNEII